MSMSRQTGASLIEVLVSIFLSAFALLALAAVNAASVKYTKMSQYRAASVLLASDLAERIRANKAGLAAYAFQNDFSYQGTLPDAPTDCDNIAETCTSAQMAAYDLAQWRRTVRDQLPQGAMYLTTYANPVAADLWVVWRDPSTAADEETSKNSECPNGVGRAGDLSIRCSYFRINL